MSLRSMEEQKQFPVQTILETAPVSEVPFPAITVNAHDYQDEWSLLRYNIFKSQFMLHLNLHRSFVFRTALNLVQIECYQDDYDYSNDVDCTATQAAREYFRPILRLLLGNVIKDRVAEAKSDPEVIANTLKWAYKYFQGDISKMFGEATQGMVERGRNATAVSDYLDPIIDLAVE